MFRMSTGAWRSSTCSRSASNITTVWAEGARRCGMTCCCGWRTRAKLITEKAARSFPTNGVRRGPTAPPPPSRRTSGRCAGGCYGRSYNSASSRRAAAAAAAAAGSVFFCSILQVLPPRLRTKICLGCFTWCDVWTRASLEKLRLVLVLMLVLLLPGGYAA
ncbi:unnamed protein product [Ectocarpus sp. 12 AP-2014]